MLSRACAGIFAATFLTHLMADDNLRNPFVVFCSKCSKILTDSFTLFDFKNGHMIHSFCTVREETKVEMGRESFANCMVQRVRCLCSNSIGHFLTSVSGDYNGYAGMYAFDKNSVRSYALGSTVSREKGLHEIAEDVERLKSVVAKIYKKVY
jgi:hypothetical protein